MAERRHWLAGVTAALALAACSRMLYQPPPPPDPLLVPTNYRQQIVEFMPQLIDDPSDMRDTAITEPAVRPVGGVNLYTACVRFNPKQSRTEYFGVRERLAIFHGGTLTQFIPADAGQCAKVAWQPFPELAKACYSGNCQRK
jgi:hypothetical protein